MAEMTYQEALQVAIRYGVFYTEDDDSFGVSDYYCQCCGWNEVLGHKSDCEVAQMLEMGRE